MHITQSTMDKIADNIEHNQTYLQISKVFQDIGFDLEAHILFLAHSAVSQNPGEQDCHYSTPWLTLTLGSISTLRENK